MATKPNPGVGQYNGAGGYGSEQEFLAAAQTAGQLNAAPTTVGNTVYMGAMFAKRKQDVYYGSTTTAASAAQNQFRQTIWTTDSAKRYFSMMDPALKGRVQDLVDRSAGYHVAAQWTVASSWAKAVDLAAYQTQVTGDLVSPWDVLEADAANKVGSSGGGGGGGGSGGGPSSQIQLTNASDAQLIVDQALQQYLGRDAHPKERENFLKLLNSAQVANPLRNSGGANSVTSGGVNTAEAAKEYAMSRKDSAEFMANTQYMDWFMAKIAGDDTEGVASGL